MAHDNALTKFQYLWAGTYWSKEKQLTGIQKDREKAIKDAVTLFRQENNGRESDADLLDPTPFYRDWLQKHPYYCHEVYTQVVSFKQSL